MRASLVTLLITSTFFSLLSCAQSLDADSADRLLNGLLSPTKANAASSKTDANEVYTLDDIDCSCRAAVQCARDCLAPRTSRRQDGGAGGDDAVDKGTEKDMEKQRTRWRRCLFDCIWPTRCDVSDPESGDVDGWLSCVVDGVVEEGDDHEDHILDGGGLVDADGKKEAEDPKIANGDGSIPWWQEPACDRSGHRECTESCNSGLTGLSDAVCYLSCAAEYHCVSEAKRL